MTDDRLVRELEDAAIGLQRQGLPVAAEIMRSAADRIEHQGKINAELLSACELAARHMPFPDVADVLEKVIAKANPNLSEPE